MFGAKQLKAVITVTDTTVECPVKGCPWKVKRQPGRFRRAPEFQCPRHRIYISRSASFVYPDQVGNLLCKNHRDLDLLGALKCFKRESHMEHDNSEDAVAWNVFRYPEKTGQLSAFLGWMICSPVGNAELIYWSYSQEVGRVWPGLAEARDEFGEGLERGSEPDLIIVTDKALFWIEAKITVSNETPRSPDADKKKYQTAGKGWYERVFRADYETVVTKEKKYELMRFWLLGSWAEAQMKRDFYLVNLVLAEREQDIANRFGRHLKTNAKRSVVRWTWEAIYEFVSKNAPPSRDKQMIITYFENKTVGYKQARKSQGWEPQLAFSLDK